MIIKIIRTSDITVKYGYLHSESHNNKKFYTVFIQSNEEEIKNFDYTSLLLNFEASVEGVRCDVSKWCKIEEKNASEKIHRESLFFTTFCCDLRDDSAENNITEIEFESFDFNESEIFKRLKVLFVYETQDAIFLNDYEIAICAFKSIERFFLLCKEQENDKLAPKFEQLEFNESKHVIKLPDKIHIEKLKSGRSSIFYVTETRKFGVIRLVSTRNDE